MKKLEMGKRILDDIYKVKSLDTQTIETGSVVGQITEREKFLAAKQILLGLASLYLFTLVAFLIRPNEGNKLLDISTITFPPLATLIIGTYFRDKNV